MIGIFMREGCRPWKKKGKDSHLQANKKRLQTKQKPANTLISDF